MRKTFLSFIVLLTSASMAMAANASPVTVTAPAAATEVAAIHENATDLTLMDCYRLALKRSEAIGIQKELITETEGQMLQALSGALPRVAFAYSQEWQDNGHNNNLRGAGDQGAFTFAQPLFTGFKEFAAIRASKHVGKQREAELKRAKQLLFTDVSDAFFLYMSYQEDEATVMDIRKAYFERMGELKKRQIIGRSRLSEIASAEAALRRTEATLESVRSQRDVVGELLEFLIGRSFTRLVDVGDPDAVVSEKEALSRIGERLDVVAAREELESFRENVTIARSEFFPSVTLSGDAYTKQPDGLEGDSWDAFLTVNVPLFNGLHDWGSLKQAKSQRTEAELRLSQVKRTAILDVLNSYSRWQANGREVAAMEKALTAAEKNYRLQLEDFDKNLVNNLDVLQALQDLQSVRRDMVAAKADARRSYWALKVAIGDIADESF